MSLHVLAYNMKRVTKGARFRHGYEGDAGVKDRAADGP